MGRTGLSRIALLAAAACFGHAAQAQQIDFSGSGAATASVGPLAGCAPLPFQGIASGSGTSAFGSFNYSHTVCTAGATGGYGAPTPSTSVPTSSLEPWTVRRPPQQLRDSSTSIWTITS